MLLLLSGQAKQVLKVRLLRGLRCFWARTKEVVQLLILSHEGRWLAWRGAPKLAGLRLLYFKLHGFFFCLFVVLDRFLKRQNLIIVNRNVVAVLSPALSFWFSTRILWRTIFRFVFNLRWIETLANFVRTEDILTRKCLVVFIRYLLSINNLWHELLDKWRLHSIRNLFIGRNGPIELVVFLFLLLVLFALSSGFL